MTDQIKKLSEILNDTSRLAETFKSSHIEKLLEATKGTASIKIPHIEPIKVNSPREQNGYQSAGVLMQRLADTIVQWREQVPTDSQPAILAILHGGIQINVSLLAEESFHGIRIEGTIGDSPCMLLAHQSSVQLLCHLVKVEKEEFRRKIGFIIDGEERQV